MVMEGEWTLGGECTMQRTDDVSQNCTPEIYSLTNQCHPSKQRAETQTRGNRRLKIGIGDEVFLLKIAFLLLLM